MPGDVLDRLLTEVDRPDLLKQLVEISRTSFGFFNRNHHMSIYYHWMARELEPFPAGQRMLDIGAGIYPIPLWLAARGHRVDCVDGSPLVRRLPPTPDWNEWGFFDYSALDGKLRSFNCNISAFEPAAESYDVVYAVGSLSCLSKGEWPGTLRMIKRALVPGGTLVLCVDVVRDTDFLWNWVMSENSTDEEYGGDMVPLAEHVSLSDLRGNLADAGLRIDGFTLDRQVAESPTDHLFVRCVAAKG